MMSDHPTFKRNQKLENVAASVWKGFGGMDHARVFGWISPLRFETAVHNLILGYDQGVMSGIIGADNQVDPSMLQKLTL